MLRKGRFEKSMDSEAAEYSASLEEDLRLFGGIVQINIAHVRMLRDEGIIDESDASQILGALSDLWEEGIASLDLRPELEDVHMAVEEYVVEEVGEDVGGNIHAGKSRNDQVSTAIRMVLREEVLEIQELEIGFIEELMSLADEHTETVMPGYTHLQVAEPTTFAHYLSAYAQAFVRDLERLSNSYEQINRCPLGACAFAGTSFPIDRELTSDLLGFDEVSENTMDAGGSRDFSLQVMSDLSIAMTDLSRFAEELVLWSSAEFDMLEISDEFLSTSSIMPQKKNPDVAELERAKTGKVVGDLIGGLNIMKALTQAYSLDLQELTSLLWDSVDQTKSSLKVMKKLLSGLEPKSDNMRKNAGQGLSTLTELANTLVREAGVSFRSAHSVLGKLATQANEEDKSLGDLSSEDLQRASEDIIGEKVDISEEQFEKALDLDQSVKSRELVGGPSPKSVEKNLSNLREEVQEHKERIEERMESLEESRERVLNFSEGD